MLREAFHLNPPKVLPLYAHNSLEGVFIYSGSLSAAEAMTLTEEFSLMSLCYANFVLEESESHLKSKILVTELYNHSYYSKILSDEVARARRLKQAHIRCGNRLG